MQPRYNQYLQEPQNWMEQDLAQTHLTNPLHLPLFGGFTRTREENKKHKLNDKINIVHLDITVARHKLEG